MKPLINQRYKLERFPGKGGWTFARIPEVIQDKSQPFGWVKVKGTIDGYEIKRYHLMPMGDGKLFLPVKAEIRKKIGKKEGDTVHVVLYPDRNPLDIPKEMLECLRVEPAALVFFQSLSEGQKSYYVKWIYSARKDKTKVERMAAAISRLAAGLRFHDKAW